MDSETITIVSGLPRSGTSMMMRMLEAGGMPVLTDSIRTPDEDNPRGYYEFERVKEIEHDQEWLDGARGQAVKMIAALLKHLPAGYRYRVVFMRRAMGEILASQREMLVRRGEATDAVSDERIAELFGRHVKQVTGWIEDQTNMDVLYVGYSDVLSDPSEQARWVNEFLGGGLDSDRMAQAVDPDLYRQKA